MALRQTDRPARRSSSDTPAGGFGSESIEVKGKRATSKQRRVIDGCLSQAAKDGASRRVMIATVMCITQESNAGELAGTMTGNDDVGIFQQGRNWISEAGSKDPAQSTHAFLVTGPTSWRKVHGGLKNAPGPLYESIHRVQRNARAADYAPWEDEATKTVDAWQGGDGGDGGERTIRKRYVFTRGSKDGDDPESSWEASDRLVKEVRAYRWAVGNVFHAASDDELIAAPASAMIRGDEDFLITRPQWEWGSGRPITTVTLQVLADRWGVMPGAVVVLAKELGPVAGRFVVGKVSGSSLDSPEATVELRRPTMLRPEPPAETATVGGDSEAGGGGEGVEAVYAEAVKISERNLPYVWGGGHSRVGHADGGTGRDPGTGFDCSGYVAACLHAGGFWKGSTVPGSGAFGGLEGMAGGEGEHLTVHYDAQHVWLELKGLGRWDRADTSPNGSGGRGPHVRKGSGRTGMSKCHPRGA